VANVVGRERELSTAEGFLHSAAQGFAVLVLERPEARADTPARPGSGTIAHVSNGLPSWKGEDTWTATIVVPGLSFHLDAPTLTGARSTSVRVPKRVKRIRVRYAVTARDDVDGKVAANCRPRSGSWFAVGRTLVRCSAMDTSGNERTATFAVTVKRKP
jgi:HYR domain